MKTGSISQIFPLALGSDMAGHGTALVGLLWDSKGRCLIQPQVAGIVSHQLAHLFPTSRSGPVGPCCADFGGLKLVLMRIFAPRTLADAKNQGFPLLF